MSNLIVFFWILTNPQEERMVMVLDINLTPPQEEDDGGMVLELNFTLEEEEDGEEVHILEKKKNKMYIYMEEKRKLHI
jgi:hypothetical protein